MEKVVRLPSAAEKERAEASNKQAWFPHVGAWWKNDKGNTFFKLDLIPDAVFMLQVPKEKSQPEEDLGF